MAYDTIMPNKALLILDSKTILEDGRIIQRRIWQLARAELEIAYNFTCLAQLLLDFVADIERRSGEIK